MWGWWLLFQFPIIGLFTYLQKDWPENFPELVRFSCLAILGGEVLLQILLYLKGMTPGDHLSGTFGWNGTGYLVLFVLFVLCLALGEWLATRNWIPVLLTVGLGIISSALGEMKIFLPLVLLLGLFSLGYLFIQSRNRLNLIPYSLIFFTIISAFLVAYNGFVPAARQVPLEKFLTDPQSLLQYMNASTRFVAGQNYYTDIGRNFALQYGWNQLKGDPITLLFGMGLGARSESSALGMAGQGLVQGELGISTGTSLLVMMQEIGIVGLIAIFGFFLYIVYRLFKNISRELVSKVNGLRFGLILFTMLWPVLLWYNTAWTARVAMLLYWGILGYALRPTQDFSPAHLPGYSPEKFSAKQTKKFRSDGSPQAE